MIGRTLSHFRIVAKIGEGGMGVVYRAEDTDLRRPVALKVLPPELVGNEERRLRFVREARAAAAVTHPNIATIYEVGEASDGSGQGPGIVFIAMEFVEGETLRELIRGGPSAAGGRPMPIKTALRIATQIAEGLAKAHQSQVIHRDLKPENVVVAADGHAKILDFGLAKLLDERRMGAAEEAGRRPAGGEAAGKAGRSSSDISKLDTISREMTEAGRVFGTAAYMSPEQARGERVDARSDIFSFGATLYEMVTGRTPFQGRTAIDTMSAILQKEPAPPRSLNPGIPADLERVISKCLRKDPGERYQHTDEVAVDLREIRRATDTGARVVVEAPTRPHRSLAARVGWRGAAVGATVAAAGLGVMALLAMLDVGGIRALLRPGRDGAGAERIDSLAVLPLRNLSGDPAQEYFADGMTEELTATLARIQALKVISSTSASYYKGAKKPLREIAAELGVDAVVEGSVMRSGDRVRVTAQLVEGATDRHLWASSYERDLRDILALQAEVARAIAGEVRAALTPGEAARLAEARPVNPEAYEHYLTGLHLKARLTAEGLTRAAEEFERAIAMDPGYAPAHAGLALAYIAYSDWSVAPRAEAWPKARAAALRAIELDPALSHAHLVLADIKGRFNRDWAGAEAEIRRALELNPNDPLTLRYHSGYLFILGRGDEALDEVLRAHALDPLSPETALEVATSYFRLKRYQEALVQCERILKLHPDYAPAKDMLGLTLVELGRHVEGIAALEQRLKSPDAEIPAILMFLVRAYSLAGRKLEAGAVFDDLLGLSKQKYVPPTYVVFACGALDDREGVVEWLARAIRENDVSVGILKMAETWYPLRSDPRVAKLLREANIP